MKSDETAEQGTISVKNMFSVLTDLSQQMLTTWKKNFQLAVYYI